MAVVAGGRKSAFALLLRDMLVLLGAVAALWLLHAYGRVLATGGLVAAWLLLTVVSGGGLFWRSRIRRRALLTAYLVPESVLFRWLRGGWLMAMRQFVMAALLAAALAVALVRTSQPAVWSALVLTAPVLVVMRAVLDRWLAPHVNARYRPELGWRLTLGMAGTLLFACLVVLMLYRDYPVLADVSLERAVWHMVDRELARSPAFETLLQMAAAKDALRLWLAQQLLPGVGTVLLQLAAWIVVLAEEVLFVWSYLLFCNGVVIGINGIGSRG